MEFVKKEKEIFESYIFVFSTIPSILGKTRKNKTMQNNNQKINKIKIKINRKPKRKQTKEQKTMQDNVEQKKTS
jgi:hypothetical protein